MTYGSGLIRNTLLRLNLRKSLKYKVDGASTLHAYISNKDKKETIVKRMI